MIKRKEGRIVCIGSVQGKFAIPHRSAYSASKHALQAFCDSLRAEVACHNIKVLLVSPGYMNTALSLNALTGTGRNYGSKKTLILSYFVYLKFVNRKINKNYFVFYQTKIQLLTQQLQVVQIQMKWPTMFWEQYYATIKMLYFQLLYQNLRIGYASSVHHYIFG